MFPSMVRASHRQQVFSQNSIGCRWCIWFVLAGKRRQNSTSWILIDCIWLIQLEGSVGNHGGPKRLDFGSAMFTCLHHLGEKFQWRGFRVEATPTLVLVGLPCQELAVSTCFVLRVCDIWPSAQLWPRTLHALQTFPHKSFEGQIHVCCFLYTSCIRVFQNWNNQKSKMPSKFGPTWATRVAKKVCVSLGVPWGSQDSEETCWYHATWMHQFPCQKMFVVSTWGWVNQSGTIGTLFEGTWWHRVGPHKWPIQM